MDKVEVYLKAMMSLIARQTFTVERLAEIVATTPKHVDAYNMCDGNNAQADISKAVGLDSGNFSRVISRWIEEGVVIKVATVDGDRPVHVYPLPVKYKKVKST